MILFLFHLNIESLLGFHSNKIPEISDLQRDKADFGSYFIHLNSWSVEAARHVEKPPL